MRRQEHICFSIVEVETSCIAKNTQTGYYAFTKDMTVCMDCSHVTMGLKEACEKCHSKNLDYISRITGWNEGKKQELLDRIRYGANEVR
jgi:anaerobic ribonucleoside-triphosphate reductase